MDIIETIKKSLLFEKIVNLKIDWTLLIILFLFIYQPPLFRFNIVYILIVLLNIIIYRKQKRIFYDLNVQFLRNKALLYLVICSSLLIIYLLFSKSFSIVNYKQIYTIALTLILYLYCGFLIAKYFIIKGFSTNRFLEYFVLIGILQAIISIFSYTFPELRNSIVNFYIFRGYPKEVYLYMTWRLYGFSSTLTYAMPIVQSFIACIALYLGFNKRLEYFFAIPLLLFSSMINSRFGFLVFFPVAIIQFAQMQLKSHRFSKKDISLTMLLVGLGTLALFFIIYITIPTTWSWISSSFIDIGNFLSGKLTGFFAEIFGANSSQFALPQGLAFLLGVGKNIMGGIGGYASDIGFVNDIWIGGILYTVVIWAMFSITFYYVMIKSVLNQRVLLLILLCFMIISNIKGMVITPNELMSCVYVFLTFFILKLNSLE